VAPLVALAQEIAASRELSPGAVPYPDPDYGGVYARVLVLLDSPAAASAAERLVEEQRAAGLEPAQTLQWSAVPWPTQRRSPSAQELREARGWLPKLLALLPELRVAVLLGVPAQQYWGTALAEAPAEVPLVPVLAGPHPSLQAGTDNRLTTVLRRAAEAVNAETAAAPREMAPQEAPPKVDRGADELTAGYDLAYRLAQRFTVCVLDAARDTLREGSRALAERRSRGR
jgi:hypothetical protein